MTMPRMVGLLVGLAVVGIAVVAIRVDQVRTSWRIQQMQFDENCLRREIWTQEMERARLLAPGMIRDRAVRLGVEVESPPSKPSVSARR